MIILRYQDMEVRLTHMTGAPMRVIREACETTMKGLFASNSDLSYVDKDKGKKLLEFLIHAGHTSVLEHVTFTWDIRNVSRSFLAQITRHRMGSFTSSSQHYQDHSQYPVVINEKYIGVAWYFDALLQSMEAYDMAIDKGMPRSEARQLLPNAVAVKLTWTVNARSLINFCEQRCCNRNVDEMRIFANRIVLLVSAAWPELGALLGPQCHSSYCKQRHMQCAMHHWEQI